MNRLVSRGLRVDCGIDRSPFLFFAITQFTPVRKPVGRKFREVRHKLYS